MAFVAPIGPYGVLDESEVERRSDIHFRMGEFDTVRITQVLQKPFFLPQERSCDSLSLSDRVPCWGQACVWLRFESP